MRAARCHDDACRAVDLAGANQRIVGGRAGNAVVEHEVGGNQIGKRDVLQRDGVAAAEIDERIGSLLRRMGLDVRQAEDSGNARHVDPVALAMVEVGDEVGISSSGFVEYEAVSPRSAGDAVVPYPAFYPVVARAPIELIVAITTMEIICCVITG